MMATYLVTIAVIFALALGGILIDRVYRRFADLESQLVCFMSCAC